MTDLSFLVRGLEVYEELYIRYFLRTDLNLLVPSAGYREYIELFLKGPFSANQTVQVSLSAITPRVAVPLRIIEVRGEFTLPRDSPDAFTFLLTRENIPSEQLEGYREQFGSSQSPWNPAGFIAYPDEVFNITFTAGAPNNLVIVTEPCHSTRILI